MSATPPRSAGNCLINALPRKQRSTILQQCEAVALVFGTTLCEPGDAYRHVYFPLSGFISLVGAVGDHPPLELGLIGDEGMLGATLVLGIDTVPLRGVVQGSGNALRMSTAQFRNQLRDSAILLRVLNRYLYVLIGQLSQGAACTRFHEVEPRLARWLLMTHDRSRTNHLLLSHAFLADMLGVRRSAVTIAAGALQRRNLIRYSRGSINILDRKGLEGASCECYRRVIDANARLLA